MVIQIDISTLAATIVVAPDNVNEEGEVTM